VETTVARERNLEQAKETLERRVYAAEAQVNLAKEERLRLEREFSSQSKKDKAALMAEISSLTDGIKTLQDEKSKLSAMYEKEKIGFSVQAEKIDLLGREIRVVTQSGLEREKVLESTARDLRESQSVIAALRKEIANLREKVDKKDAQMDSLRGALDNAKTEIVDKDKSIVQLEFIIATTTSPVKKSRDDESYLKLQRREKEVVRLREMMAALIRDNEELLSDSTERIAPEQQRKYNAMKNILRAERETRKGLEKDLARALAKEQSRKEDLTRTPGARSVVSMYATPGSGIGGLDTPVSLNDTPLRAFGGADDTPLKGKGVLVE
jgi:chromosome segregation ATPase